MVNKVSNTPKGRSSVPHKPGVYNLKNRDDDTVYTGETNDLHRRISEHYQDPNKHFASVTYKPTSSKAQAQRIEERRLDNRKPPLNKRK